MSAGPDATEQYAGPDTECMFVDFGDEPERCGADATIVRIGGVTVSLCDEHAEKARAERGET